VTGETAAAEPLDEEAITSLADKLYFEIRDRIMAGAFPQGSRLRERELADAFGVSRIPLREALPRLEADGFVATSPRRGARVAQLTVRDIEEVYTVRLGVDVFAARLAALRVAAGASPAALVTAIGVADAALAGGDFDTITTANSDLHEEIVLLAGNSLLTAMMRPVTGRARWVSRLTSYPDPGDAQAEHHALRDAILAGNAELAAALQYAHIESGREPTLSALRGILPAT